MTPTRARSRDTSSAARAGLERLTPERAFDEVRDGALLVDTRTFEQRRVQGDVPGAMRIDRTVFEWRLDPTGPWCIPEVSGADARIIVMCRQGFSSSLAAASLQSIGLTMRHRHHRRLRGAGATPDCR